MGNKNTKSNCKNSISTDTQSEIEIHSLVSKLKHIIKICDVFVNYLSKPTILSRITIPGIGDIPETSWTISWWYKIHDNTRKTVMCITRTDNNKEVILCTHFRIGGFRSIYNRVYDNSNKIYEVHFVIDDHESILNYSKLNLIFDFKVALREH